MKRIMSATLMLCAVSCTKTASTSEENQSQFDIETAYLSLSAETQKEILGVEVLSKAEVRQELMAKADKDADGKLSEEEKVEFRAQWKEVKEQMAADWKARLDSDKDGEISSDEMRAGLNQLGQKIKTAIQSTLEQIRTAHQEAREKIQDACQTGPKQPEPASLKSDAGKSTDAVQDEESDIKIIQDELKQKTADCQSITQEEKDKFHELLKKSLEELQIEINELKEKLSAIEGQEETISI